MASFLSASLLAQSQQSVQTRQALIVLGLQNDFVSLNGKLPVSNASGYLDRVKELVPAFREHGIIIWVRSEYRGNRAVNEENGCMVVVGDGMSNGSGPARDQAHDPRVSSGSPPRRSYHSSRRVDDVVQRVMNRVVEYGVEDSSPPPLPASSDNELFLSRTEDREPCCLPGTEGAEYAPEIAELMQPQDLHITKSFYSAFSRTNLLFYLHTRFITQVYFVGCNTNLSVYATAMDAARHGIEMHVVEDCLGYRQKDRHDQAVRQLVDNMGAYATTASSVLSKIRGEFDMADAESEEGSDVDAVEDDTESVRERFHIDRVSGNFQDMMLSDHSSLTAVEQSRVIHTTEHTEPPITQHADASRLTPEFFSNAQKRPRESISQNDTDFEQRLGPSDLLDNTGTMQGVYTITQTLTQAQASAPEESGSKSESLLKSRSPARETVKHSESFMTTDPSQITTPSQLVDVAMPHPWRSKKQPQQNTMPTLGPGDEIGSGDTQIIFDLLPSSRSDVVFQQLLQEVCWQKMYHVAGEVPRLVCCQGDIDPSDGSMPVYRHPSDSSLPLLHWSPAVAAVRKTAEAKVGHKLNHVLIQLYRTGQDHISEHTDKTLDIVPNSKIVNVSFGAERTMRLRTKAKRANTDLPNSLNPAKRRKSIPGLVTEVSPTSKSPEPATDNQEPPTSRNTQRISMPHNSMFVMGLATNESWLHGIMPDKRQGTQRSSSELAYGSMRISLTFRRIGTFLSSDSRLIWGQGATSKIQHTARSTINGVETESQRVINAFSNENQSTAFDWLGNYGAGFDVLHLKSPLPYNENPMLFFCATNADNLSIKLYLSHLGIGVQEFPALAIQGLGILKDAGGNSLRRPRRSTSAPCFRDTDPLHTQVVGVVPILLYLDRAYARYLMSTAPAMLSQAARELEILASPLLSDLRALLGEQQQQDHSDVAVVEVLEDLESLLLAAADECMSGSGRDGNRPRSTTVYLAGLEFGIADCAVWPLVRELMGRGEGLGERFPVTREWVGWVGGKVDPATLASSTLTMAV